MKKFLYIICIFTICISCSTSKKSTNKQSSIVKTVQRVERNNNNNNNSAKEISLSTKEKNETPPYNNEVKYQTCSFKVTTTYKGFPVNVSVRTTHDSIFWMSATSLGFEAMRIQITKDSVYIIDKIEKKYKQMTPERATMLLGVPLSFDFVQNLLMDTTLITSYNTTVFSGTVIKQLTNINDMSLPKKVDMEGKIKGQNQKISLTVKDYKFDLPLTYPFDIPKDYKR